MKVVMLIQHYLPTIGGAERQLASLVPLLVERGARVTVITRGEPGLARHEPIGGAVVLRVAARGPKLTRSLAYTVGALRHIRRIRPDVLHAHDMLSPTTTAMLAARLWPAGVVVKVLRSGSVGDIARLLTKPFGRRRLRSMRRRVDRFVAISSDIDRELAIHGIPDEHRAFVPNGVDLTRFRPVGDDERGRRRRALGCDAGPVAVYSGRLAPEKRIDVLVRAWPRIRVAVPGAQLVVVGGGPLREELESAAGDGVRILGPVDDVADILAAADVFVLPSLAEGLSNSMLEAMACGLGVVATRVGGAEDLLTDGVSGRLVDADDLRELEAAVAELLADQERCRDLGAAARRAVAEGYALPHTADALVSLYRSVSGR